FQTTRRPRCPPLFPYTTLFRSTSPTQPDTRGGMGDPVRRRATDQDVLEAPPDMVAGEQRSRAELARDHRRGRRSGERGGPRRGRDRKSTRLNSSHVKISYAVFC